MERPDLPPGTVSEVMADKLTRYRDKRSFERTPEPAGGPDREGGAAPRFVIQQHSARRLHWDLRLEHDGVAASWAVPNGIPQRPNENRKAVHTEDHPLEYLDFEGEIPAGNYGAGSMTIWDTGTYEPHEWSEKKVTLTFHGAHVNGRYALFHAGREPQEWMVHRIDPPADPDTDPMPHRVVPMLARAGSLPADEDRYGYEIKWDGVRAIAYAEPGRLRLESRNLTDITAAYPELRALSRQLGAREAVLDGEIVAFDSEGHPSFERLQQRMHLTSDAQIRRRAREVPATYVIFDLLHLDGETVMGLPYAERRRRLEELGLEGERWRTPPTYAGSGRDLLAASAKLELEGVVAKRLDSRYEPGQRSSAWVKVKNKRTTELVIGGWLPGSGRRSKGIGALLAGYHDDAGELRYAGRVGTGFSDAELDRLDALLAPLARDRSPFTGGGPPRGSRYVEPRLVAEVEFTDWTREHILRHPSYKGLRDTEAEQVVVDPAAAGDGGQGDPGAAEPAIGPLKPLQGGAVEAAVEGRKLRLTNLDKVLYPRTGFSKGQLIDYYARIAPALLPHLRGRPLTLKRYPNGVEAKYFYEKQCPKHRPDWVETRAVYSRQNDRDIDFCIVSDLPTLIWTANLASVELHTSLALAATIERPTMMVFDLDPGAPADIVACCRVGCWLREIFEPLGLRSYPKTSGSKGLQVYVPLNSDQVTYADTKPFAKAVAELLEKQHPELVVSRMSKQLRPGKVFVDWSQNDEHKTTVCVYSMRAKDAPTASTPVSWDEVEACAEGTGPLSFDYAAVLERVAERGDLFAETLTTVQALPEF